MGRGLFGYLISLLYQRELVARDKASLDIAQEMIEDLEAALEQLRAIAGDLSEKAAR